MFNDCFTFPNTFMPSLRTEGMNNFVTVRRLGFAMFLIVVATFVYRGIVTKEDASSH
jgi:hypothetical protein